MFKKSILILLYLSLFASINLNPIQFNELNLVQQIRLTSPLFFFIILVIFCIKELNFNFQNKIIGFIFLFLCLLYSYFTFKNLDNNNLNLFWPFYMLITCITIYGFSDNFDKNIILGIALIFLVAVFAFFNLLVINSMIERSNFHFYGMMGSTFSEQGINYANIKNAPRPSGLARIALILYASTCAYYLFSKSKKLIVLVLIFIFGSFVLLYQSRTASFIFLFLNLFMIIF